MNVSCSETRVEKFRRLRFTYNDDIAFLKEFLAYNHMQNENGWEIIQNNLELAVLKKFSVRTLKHHLHLLLDVWAKKEQVDKKRSGVEEILSEKDVLLQEISTLCSESDFTLSVKRKRTVSKHGKKARNQYLVTSFLNCDEDIENNAQSDTENNTLDSTQVSEVQQDHIYVQFENEPVDILEEVTFQNTDVGEQTISLQAHTSTAGIPMLDKPQENITKIRNTLKKGTHVLGPTRRRLNRREPIRNNALTYLNDKSQRENEIRTKELELENRKLCIEERRLILQEKKVEIEEKRLEFEIRERLQRIELEKDRAEIELLEKKLMLK